MFIIPRHVTDIYYDVSTPDESADEVRGRGRKRESGRGKEFSFNFFFLLFFLFSITVSTGLTSRTPK